MGYSTLCHIIRFSVSHSKLKKTIKERTIETNLFSFFNATDIKPEWLTVFLIFLHPLKLHIVAIFYKLKESQLQKRLFDTPPKGFILITSHCLLNILTTCSIDLNVRSCTYMMHKCFGNVMSRKVCFFVLIGNTALQQRAVCTKVLYSKHPHWMSTIQWTLME